MIKVTDELNHEDIWQLKSKSTPNGTYFIQCHDFVKIGKTADDVDTRMSTLQVGCPYELRLIKITNDCEKDIQARFEHLKVRGEWYKLNKKLIGFIDSL